MLDLSQFTFKLVTFSKHQIVCLTLARSLCRTRMVSSAYSKWDTTTLQDPPENHKKRLLTDIPQEMSQLKASPIRLKRNQEGCLPYLSPLEARKKANRGTIMSTEKRREERQPKKQFLQGEGKTFSSHGIISKLPIFLRLFRSKFEPQPASSFYILHKLSRY